MSEERQQFDDEIDLFELFETVWNGKWTIVLTSFLATLLAFGYILIKPASYTVTAELNTASPSVFTRYAGINEVLKANSFDYLISNENIFNSFVSEFNDYEELKAVLSDNEYVRSVLSETEAAKRENVLVSFAKEFKIQPPAKNQTNWTVGFEWNDADEGKKILDSAFNQTLANVKASVLMDIEALANAVASRNELKIQKLKADLASLNEAIALKVEQRSLFLKEQAAIARALDIQKNQLDDGGLAQSQSSSVTLSVNATDTPFYLRGYAAIEAELELLESRSSKTALKFDDRYVSIMSNLAAVEHDASVQQVLAVQQNISNANESEWIVFDSALADVKSKTKPSLILALAIVLGGMLGTLIVLIRGAVRKRKERTNS
jgi:LPS O-antigen subunit length determinant protein (WzzB/FepE family)